MFKKNLGLSLVLFLMASLSVFGAKKPKDERLPKVYEKIKPEENIVSKYLTTSEPGVLYPVIDDTVGWTYLDAQHDNSMRRQIAKDYLGNLHFTWMDSISQNMNEDRYVDYNALNPYGTWLAAGTGIRVTSEAKRGGYCGLDIFPDSREVLAYQMDSAYTGQNPWFTTLSIENDEPGYGSFVSYDIPDSVTSKWQGLTYPHIACSKDTVGNAPYIHITNFSEERVGNKPPYVYRYYAGYVRCYEVSEDTLACQSPGWPSPIKIKASVKLAPNKLPYLFPAGDGKIPYNAAPVATSPVSQKVAIAWYDNVGSYDKGEIYYIESTNNGDDWMTSGDVWPRHQITNYGENNWVDYKTNSPEIATVYDYNDVLHVFWTTNTTFNQEKSKINGRILWHWSSVTGIRQVVSNFVTVDCGDSNYAIAKPTAGVGCLPGDTAYNYLYVVYTKFNDSDTSASGFANGDLYLKASSNGGLSWGPEENLTNTNSNGCIAGNCKSEHWSSVAERVDSFLYVQYIYDLDAGSAIYREGSFTDNPVRYLKIRRPLVPAVPGIYYAPSQLTSPTEWATNHNSTTDSIKFDNIGTATLDVQLSGPSWMTLTPNSFNIVEAGPTKIVLVGLNGGPYADTLLVDSLKIESNNDTSGEVYTDIEWVKIHFVVTDSFYYAEYDTVAKAIVTTVSNVGNLGNEEDGHQMTYNGHDYLYDCSTVLCTNIPGYGHVGASWVLDRHDFLPESHLQVTDCPNLKSTRVKSTYVPINPTIAQPYHWFWWWWSIDETELFFWNRERGNIHCEQAILKSVILHKNPPPPWWCDIAPQPPTLPEVYFGIAADWDVPAEAYAKNLGGYDDTLNLIWQKADSLPFTNYYGAILFLGADVIHGTNTVHYNAPYGAHVLNNATQLYPLAGYNDDSLYKYLSAQGWSIEQDSAQDMNIVMSAIDLLGNLDTVTEVTVKYVLMVTDKGLDSLRYLAAQFRKVKCGDANVDGKVTVSDVVYLVNYLFKGGPEPWLYYSDANGDCKVTVSDVVYLVNYLFKGGPSPRCNCPTCDP